MTTPAIPNLPIPDLPAPLPLPKWWGNSMTIWGTLLTAATTVLPVVAPALGLDLTPEMMRQLGNGVMGTAQALGGVIGTGLAIWGRIRATAPIERRQFNLTV
jgi:hypothetical protein